MTLLLAQATFHQNGSVDIGVTVYLEELVYPLDPDVFSRALLNIANAALWTNKVKEVTISIAYEGISPFLVHASLEGNMIKIYKIENESILASAS